MNTKFNKALYLLDKGDYEKGEACLLEAIAECGSQFELMQIKCCYAELLMELERYDDARQCAEFILSNTDEYGDNEQERETAREIIDYLEGEEL